MSREEFESLTEAAYWAAVPGIAEDIAEAEASIDSGQRTSVAELRQLLAERRAQS